MKDLCVVIPVYNEAEVIGSVLDKWVIALNKLNIDYQIHAYNDGSKDQSLLKLQEKAQQYPEKIKVTDKKNSGHGPTILQGYKEATQAGYEWIFQIDSDDEMGPESFVQLWNQRQNYDFLVGFREGRKQPLPRKIISAISRATVRIFFGKSIWDVNTPYRLMRREEFEKLYNTIPADTFAPNVIISGLASQNKLRCTEIPVPQHDRTTGEVSIQKWKLFKAAIKSFFQTISFSFKQKNKSSLIILSVLFALLCLPRCASLRECFNIIFGGVDFNVFYTIGEQMNQGMIPYKDLFDHKGPIIYFINFISAWCGGPQYLILFEFLSLAITMWFLLKGLLNIIKIPIVCLIFLGSLIYIYIFWEYGNTTEGYALPAVTYGYYCLITLIKQEKLSNFKSIFWGVSTASVLLLKFNHTAIFIVVIGYAIYFCLKNKQYKIWFCKGCYYALGVFLFCLPFFIYLFYNNAINDFFNCYWNFNYIYAGNDITVSQKLLFIVNRICCLQPMLFCPILLLPWIGIITFCFTTQYTSTNKKIYYAILILLFIEFFYLWSGPAAYYHYSITTLPAFIYAEAIAIENLNKIKLKLNINRIIFILELIMIFILMIYFSRVYFIKNDIYSSEKLNIIKQIVKKNNNKILVWGNDCEWYRVLKATPSFKYFYLPPHFEKSFIYNEMKKELESGNIKLIFNSSSCSFGVFHNFINNNYDIIKTPIGQLYKYRKAELNNAHK